MIDRKVILYVLAGIIAFALWEAWQKDYGQLPVAETKKEEVVPVIPSPGKVSLPQKEESKSILETAPEKDLIKVKTDVLDVEIDRIGGNIVRANLLEFPDKIDGTKAVRVLSDDKQKYYVAQSGLLGENGPDSFEKQGRYFSSQKSYVLGDKENLEVKLKWTGDKGVVVEKNFTFSKGKYNIDVDYLINNKSKKDWVGRFYSQIKRKDFEPKKSFFQFNTYTGAAVSSKEKPYEKISFSDIEDSAKKNKEFIRDSEGGWIAMQQRYFISAWVPSQEQTYRYFSSVSNDGVYTIGLSEGETVVPAGKQGKIGSVLYVGPEVAENLKPLAPGLDLTVDYGWLWILSAAFFWLLKNLYKLVGNWGLAIILVTFLIKLAFYKLSESSCRSMARMRDIMPKIQALKDRYGDDKQKLQQATMELYKREKINPLNLGGCLPMLIQIPFFIALYYVLIGAVELRHAPFMLWINDLSVRDPFYVLPILMGASMFLQQKLTPSSADPAQAKMMMLMPVLFTFFFLNFPAGLVLYWLASNLLSILQQWYINRKIKKES